ncbi:hypothetical protein ACFQ9X_23520 [Catenulispora yoronensis]
MPEPQSMSGHFVWPCMFRPCVFSVPSSSSTSLLSAVPQIWSVVCAVQEVAAWLPPIVVCGGLFGSCNGGLVVVGAVSAVVGAAAEEEPPEVGGPEVGPLEPAVVGPEEVVGSATGEFLSPDRAIAAAVPPPSTTTPPPTRPTSARRLSLPPPGPPGPPWPFGPGPTPMTPLCAVGPYCCA